MNELAFIGSMGLWIGIISSLLFALCLYFFLTFFEHLKYGDDRLIKQSKLFAVISLVLALMVPVFYQLFLFYQMMS